MQNAGHSTHSWRTRSSDVCYECRRRCWRSDHIRHRYNTKDVLSHYTPLQHKGRVVALHTATTQRTCCRISHRYNTKIVALHTATTQRTCCRITHRYNTKDVLSHYTPLQHKGRVVALHTTTTQRTCCRITHHYNTKDMLSHYTPLQHSDPVDSASLSNRNENFIFVAYTLHNYRAIRTWTERCSMMILQPDNVTV